MLLKLFNKSLIHDREKTYLTTSAAAGDTSLTVVSTDLAPAGTSSNTWADNDYMIVGEIGSENAEVMQMSAAVTSATSLTIDREGQSGGLRYAHALGEPVYRIGFNQVEFSHATSDSTASLTVLATVNIQADDDFTRYEDVTYTTGYGFGRFKNQTTSAYSSYSDGVNYESTGVASSRDPRTLWVLRKKVRKLLEEFSDLKLTDEEIDQALNDKQRDIAHQDLWSFFEDDLSASSVDDQFAYSLPSTVQKIHSARFDTQPLVWINKRRWDSLHWDSDTDSSDPSHFSIWNNQLLVWPRPSASASTTTLSGAISASATTITVASTTSFNRGEYYRFIIDSEVIWATGATSTTFTGCLRGQEGTTAAAHLDAATVTERDIIYNTHVEPTDLIYTQDRTRIPEPDVLAYGAAMDLCPVDEKLGLHDRLQAKFENGIKSLQGKYVSKQSAQFSVVKSSGDFISGDWFGSSNPNNFPTNIG